MFPIQELVMQLKKRRTMVQIFKMLFTNDYDYIYVCGKRNKLLCIKYLGQMRYHLKNNFTTVIEGTKYTNKP